MLGTSMESDRNLFPESEPDRREIWDMLVRRDIDAFVNQDWAAHEADFLIDEFVSIDAQRSPNPDNWHVSFPDIAAYAKTWLKFSEEAARTAYAESVREAHLRASHLTDIEIRGDVALARKKFDGKIRRLDGTDEILKWQTLYLCRRKHGRWWIQGFVGFLPNPMG